MPAAVVRRRLARSIRSETRGTVYVPDGYRKALLITSTTDPVGRAGSAAHVFAPLEGPRAASGSRREVGARSVVRKSRPAAGGAPSVVSQVAAEFGRAATESFGDRGTVPIAQGKRATVHGVLGWSGGRRPAAGAVVAHRAVERGGAGLRSGEEARAGTSSSRSPGTSIVAPEGAIP